MANNRQKTKLSLIKSEERAPDGNLLPEARKRVIQSIQTYLPKVGHLNISEMAQQLGLSRSTTKKTYGRDTSKVARGNGQSDYCPSEMVLGNN